MSLTPSSTAILIAVAIIATIGSNVVDAFSFPHQTITLSKDDHNLNCRHHHHYHRDLTISCSTSNSNSNVNESDDDLHSDYSSQVLPPVLSSRRNVLLQLVTAPVAVTVSAVQVPFAAVAQELEQTTNRVHITATWKSVDGLNSLEPNESAASSSTSSTSTQQGKKFVSFENSAYAAMKDDTSRTPFFEKAIINRLNDPTLAPNGPESQTVLDLGTGPYALFAILAAKAGAGKVYAIEASASAAREAREVVSKLGYDDVITILEGFSTDIVLPGGDKADFVVAEIVGSIASEEGAYASIIDAHERLVKEPSNSNNWIPSRIQTLAAPASYTLHNLFQPPAFDWGKLNGEPVRFNCRDEGLQLLADPLIVEDISFADITNKGGTGGEECNNCWKKEIKFVVDGERIEDNSSSFYKEYRNNRLSKNESENLARSTAQSLSGIALWPRLLLDGGETIEVNSRSYPSGGHQKSHWQTVLPIMSDVPVAVKSGDEVLMNVNFDVTRDVLRPSTYTLDGDVIQK